MRLDSPMGAWTARAAARNSSCPIQIQRSAAPNARNSDAWVRPIPRFKAFIVVCQKTALETEAHLRLGRQRGTYILTPTLGIRAFGTQLLCDQVIGRRLSRQPYHLNEEGY